MIDAGFEYTQGQAKLSGRRDTVEVEVQKETFSSKSTKEKIHTSQNIRKKPMNQKETIESNLNELLDIDDILSELPPPKWRTDLKVTENQRTKTSTVTSQSHIPVLRQKKPPTKNHFSSEIHGLYKTFMQI